MDLAVPDTTARFTSVLADRERRLDSVVHTSEWADPEGDDWFSAIYRELAREPESGRAGEQPAPELDHWFG